MDYQEIFNQDWLFFIQRFFINLATVIVISRLFYFARGRGSREYLFTYIGASITVFLVCILVSHVKVELGLAIGLFAVFSVIRFRSESATPRELAYLFICLGLALALALLPMSTPPLRILVNFVLILIVLGLVEFLVFRSAGVTKTIIYDRLDLLEAGKEEELARDLATRFGLQGIRRIRIGDIDTIKLKVRIRVEIKDEAGKHFQE